MTMPYPLPRQSRRAVIQASAGSFAAASILPSWAMGRAVNPFSQGVASGDPTSSGFVIWTRLAPAPLAPDGQGGIRGEHPVRWSVATDVGMNQIVARGIVMASDLLNHSVRVPISGLKPNRPYWYRFEAQGWQSDLGRSRTLPVQGAELDQLRLAFVSCSNWEEGYFTAYSQIVADQPDFVVFLGDYIYEYNNGGQKAEGRPRLHVGPEATDLASYRLRYSLYRTDPNLQRLHASIPALMTWDDHEVENDYAGSWSEHADVPVDAFLARRRAAYQAFYENMPLRPRSRLLGDAMQVYDRFRFGNLVELPILDGRQYRDRQPCPKGDFRGGHVVPDACTERTDPSRSMLGPAQERWLFEGFKQSDACWNVIAQDLLVASLIQKGTDGTIGHWTDGWDGFPACRDRMLGAVKSSAMRNPVFFGGDIHSFWTTDLKADFNNPMSETIATEFVGGSISADAPPYAPFAEFLPRNPHVKYFESRAHGYMIADITRQAMTTRFRAVDRLQKVASATTLAAFVVESGKTGAVQL